MAWRYRYLRAPTARPATGASRRPTGVVEPRQIAIVIILAAGIALTYIDSRLDSGLRYGLYVLLLLAVAWIVVAYVYRTSARLPSLSLKSEQTPIPGGDLARLTVTLERADRGMRYSQVMVALRLRRAFLSKLKSLRHLDDEALRRLLEDREELSKLVGDPVIVEFLEDPSEGDEMIASLGDASGERFRFVKGQQFSRGLARVIKAMEEWQ